MNPSKPFMMKFKTLLVMLSLACATGAQAISVTVNTTPTHCGLTNGKATASVTGGVSPYAFLWGTGATTATLNGIAAGTYSVTVTDANGEVANGSGVVQADPLLAEPYAIPLSVDCDYVCSGSVAIYENQLGGTPPYSYVLLSGGSWSGGHSPAEIYSLCYGTTPLTITDASGCTVDVQLWVDGTSAGSPSISSVQPACGSQANGSMIMSPTFSESEYEVVGPNDFDSVYYFPGEPQVISGLLAGQYTVYYGPNTVGGCTMPAEVTIPSIPEPCGSISGVLFNDVNGNCNQDIEDISLPWRVMTLEPGPYYAFTDIAGHFEFPVVGYGNFMLSQPLFDESQMCPSAAPIAVTIDGSTPVVNLIIADSSHVSLDLEVLTQGTAMRPGFSWSRSIIVRNNSAYPSGPATITLNYDPVLDPLSYGSAGAAIWNVTSIAPYGQVQYYITGALPPDVMLLGTQYTFTASVSNTLPESNLGNNTVQAVETVVGSYDPNDKHGYTNATRSETQFFLDQDSWLDYTIRFQNTGTDTAFTVVVRDTLDTDLNITSVMILGSSHGVVPSFEEGRVLVFTFSDILLPDSTTDLLGSQGFISFRVKPTSGIMIGDVVENTAGIYFDFNDPVITNTVTHVVEMSTGIEVHAGRVIRLAPNPVSDVLFVMDLQDTKGTIEVLAADGRRVAVPHVRMGTTLQLDVHALAPGVYILRTVNGTARFVKN